MKSADWERRKAMRNEFDWVGVSVEDQKTANERIPRLIR